MGELTWEITQPNWKFQIKPEGKGWHRFQISNLEAANFFVSSFFFWIHVKYVDF